jgi:hypothetical protein
LAYLEEIVPESGFSQAADQSHAEKVAPEADCRVHVSGRHGQVIDAVKFHMSTHFLRSYSLVIIFSANKYSLMRNCSGFFFGAFFEFHWLLTADDIAGAG